MTAPDDGWAAGDGLRPDRPKVRVDSEPLEARVQVIEADPLLHFQFEFAAGELAPDLVGLPLRRWFN